MESSRASSATSSHLSRRAWTSAWVGGSKMVSQFCGASSHSPISWAHCGALWSTRRLFLVIGLLVIRPFLGDLLLSFPKQVLHCPFVVVAPVSVDVVFRGKVHVLPDQELFASGPEEVPRGQLQFWCLDEPQDLQ